MEKDELIENVTIMDQEIVKSRFYILPEDGMTILYSIVHT